MGETRKLAAILVADVVGYSRLAGTDEDRILARLRTLRSDLIDPTIAVHHGRIVKRTGDGAIVEFRSAVDAVNFAVEIQRAMAERNAEVTPDKRIEFRIGIHVGDVVEESDGDLMGDGVNIAARLQSIAKPGGICISDDTYRQVKSRLDLRVSDLGPVPLKNIAEPMRAYSLEVGISAQTKPAKTAEPVTPAAPTPQKRRFGLAPLAAALAALLVVIAGGAWWFVNANRPASVVTKTPAEAARLSIVVLPFANLSGDPGQDYLVDALTDELISSLARLRGSFVIARNKAMTFKGKPIDAKAIGKDLGVRYVLEGRRADHEHAGVAQPIEARQRVPDMKEARLQAGLERLACRGQGDRPHAAVEEFEAQMIFESANLVAERSRRDVQLQRRLGEAEMPGSALEGAKRVQRGRSAMHERFSTIS
jgi:class 3 adenylate cyclase/TolB-like protein